MTTTDIGDPRERRLVDAARAGDEHAFRALVEPRRHELHAHCYRMLGSVHDAEDAVQDALLRAWRGLPRFEGRSSPRAWLYRIATNTCLDAIARRPKRVLPIDHGPSADPAADLVPPIAESVWIDPYPDERIGAGDDEDAPEARYERRESVELAFVAALQHLPANQRAALILRDVLGFSAKETAEAVEASVASVNSALQRARGSLEGRLPDRSQQATMRALGDERLRQIATDYSDALERGDVDAILAMITEDATWSMPPLPCWFAGREGVAGFLVNHGMTVRWRHLPARANGQLAVGCYAWDDAAGAYLAAVLDVLTLRADRIAAVVGFGTPEVFRTIGGRAGVPAVPSRLFARFGLPGALPADR